MHEPQDRPTHSKPKRTVAIVDILTWSNFKKLSYDKARHSVNLDMTSSLLFYVSTVLLYSSCQLWFNKYHG